VLFGETQTSQFVDAVRKLKEELGNREAHSSGPAGRSSRHSGSPTPPSATSVVLPSHSFHRCLVVEVGLCGSFGRATLVEMLALRCTTATTAGGSAGRQRQAAGLPRRHAARGVCSPPALTRSDIVTIPAIIAQLCHQDLPQPAPPHPLRPRLVPNLPLTISEARLLTSPDRIAFATARRSSMIAAP